MDSEHAMGTAFTFSEEYSATWSGEERTGEGRKERGGERRWEEKGGRREWRKERGKRGGEGSEEVAKKGKEEKVCVCVCACVCVCGGGGGGGKGEGERERK